MRFEKVTILTTSTVWGAYRVEPVGKTSPRRWRNRGKGWRVRFRPHAGQHPAETVCFANSRSEACAAVQAHDASLKRRLDAGVAAAVQLWEAVTGKAHAAAPKTSEGSDTDSEGV